MTQKGVYMLAGLAVLGLFVFRKQAAAAVKQVQPLASGAVKPATVAKSAESVRQGQPWKSSTMRDDFGFLGKWSVPKGSEPMPKVAGRGYADSEIELDDGLGARQIRGTGINLSQLGHAYEWD